MEEAFLSTFTGNRFGIFYTASVFSFLKMVVQMDFVDFFKEIVSPQIITIVSKEYDLDYDETNDLIQYILYLLLMRLSQNMRLEGYRADLDDALETDHDGDLLEELEDYFQGREINANQDTLNSEGILEHLLGNDLSAAIKLVHNALDLDEKIVELCLYQLAPVILAVLGKIKKETGVSIQRLYEIIQKVIKLKIEGGSEMIEQLQHFFEEEDEE